MNLQFFFCLLPSLYLYALASVAQPSNKPGHISGKLVDESTGMAVEYGTIGVYQGDGLVTGGISDAEGYFDVSVSFGQYLIKIQCLGYASETRGPIAVPSGALGEVRLKSAQTELDEVVVQGERSQMQLQLDKKVYHAGSDLSNLGGSASDMLANLPSVSVDVDGNVQLRGSSSVRILIDGKPSGLVGLSSADALRQIPSTLIESVEIVTNPSARYEAEGQAGIINIILKKEQKRGLNGSFSVNTGYPHNHGASVNLNFRQKWANFL